METILERLAERFSPTAVAAWIADVLPDLVTALLVFLVFYLLWRVLAKAFSVVEARTHVDPTGGAFIRAALKYVVLTIGVLTALTEVGVNVAAIVASLGVVGLTIGFAARDTLSNLISGIFIFWDRPFVVGDLVEVGEVYGRVENITLRSTRVVTPDGKMLAIPNSTIINSIVASYTNYPHLRLDIDVTVGVDEDIDRIRTIFLEVIGDNPRYMQDPPPTAVVKALNDYNVEMQFRVWIHDEKQHIPDRFELREKIYEALRARGVEMPYETIQLAPFRHEEARSAG